MQASCVICYTVAKIIQKNEISSTYVVFCNDLSVFMYCVFSFSAITVKIIYAYNIILLTLPIFKLVVLLAL